MQTGFQLSAGVAPAAAALLKVVGEINDPRLTASTIELLRAMEQDELSRYVAASAAITRFEAGNRDV